MTTEVARFEVVEHEEFTTMDFISNTTVSVPTTAITTISSVETTTEVLMTNATNPVLNTSLTYSTAENIALEQPFTYGAVVFSATMLIPMAVFGLIANLITMIVIAKSKNLKSIFNYLLVSLCMSDMLSALFSPLPLYRQTWGFDEWQLPEELCKASFAVDALTTYVTTLHILLFAIFRLISIKWPVAFKKVTVLQVRVIIVCIWVIGFGCGFIPYWIMFKDVIRNRYSNGPDAGWSHCSLNPAWINEFIMYYKVAYPIFIYFPMASIIVLCPAIGIVIKRRRFKSRADKLNKKKIWQSCHKKLPDQNSALMECHRKHASLGKSGRARQIEEKSFEKRLRKKERNALLQLGFITGSFLMGYIPNTAHVVYTTNVVPESMAMRVLEWNLYMMGYIFLRFSECLNPIFYNLASSKMRKETKEFLGVCCRNRFCYDSNSATPQNSNDSSNGNRTINMAL